MTSGIWTAIFTGVLVLFTALLWRVNDKANETSIASQRAFITFSGLIILKNVEDKTFTGTDVYYSMTNSGTTPANDVVFEWNLSLGQTIPGKDTDFDSLPQSERGQFVLGPKANYQLKPLHLSIKDWEMVSEGRKHLFFWGWATYRDIFTGTPKRLSEFCTEITGATWSSSKHTDAATGIMTVSPPCPTHNCYDNGCQDYNQRRE